MKKLLLVLALIGSASVQSKDIAVGDEVKVKRGTLLCSAVLSMQDVQTFESARDRKSIQGYLDSRKCVKSVQRVKATVTQLGSSLGQNSFVKLSAEGNSYWARISELD